MPLTAGARLGPYEIVSALGAGGMGEVYRARDTRLDRVVAIKILPPALAADPQFVERFDREARVVSQLTHPNICTLYDVGEGADATRFLVMEYLEGETLADRIARASKSDPPGLPVDEALHISMQIADALDKAHRAGVVHRDLKPGNVMLIRAGGSTSSPRASAKPQAKLLDFGLAKTSPSTPAVAGISMLPTTPQNLTAQGTILGTFRYMAPEQLEGGEADARTDIFAFGLIVYEMITGRQVFEGKSQAALIAAILERDPAPMSTPARVVPRALERLVHECLAKDPNDRWQTARDVLRQLKAIAAGGEGDETRVSAGAVAAEAVAASRGSTRLRVASLAAALLAGAAMASVGWWISAPTRSAQPVPMHLSFALTSGGLPPAPSAQLELSPDGKWVVYPALVDGKLRLFLRGFAQASGRFIEGTDDARSPFFSPDSQWIAFVSGNVMKKIPVSGGSPMSICTMSSAAGAFTNEFVGGAWASNDTIFFVPQFNGGIWTVSAAGGGPKLLLATDEGKDRIAYLYLRVLPGGRGLVFTLVPNRAKTADELDIAVLETGASEPRTVIRGGVNAKYMSTGHLVYARNAALLAVAFDLRRLDVAGTPVPILEGVQRSSLGDAVFSLSEAGTLMYEAAGAARFDTALVEVSRKGAARSIASGQGRIQEFSISPDGGAIAARVAAENDDVWTFDAARGSPLRLTFEPGDEIWPQWMPGGSRIAFGTRTGRIFLKRSDGTGQREEIARGEFQRMPSSFSPDGKTLAFVEIHPTRKNDILLLSLDGTRKVEPFLATDADELAPKFSPDGRWLAYVSDEAGRKDVYIVPIGSSGGRKRVSSDGGTSPVWAHSGRELFFLKGDKLLSVTVDARGSPVGGDRVVLDAPKLNDLQFQVEAPFYDVLPDGDRFVMLMTPKYVPPTHFNVVVNWLEEIRQRVPVGR